MKKLAIVFLLAVGLAGIAYASPVDVTSCPFLMESNTQYIVTQDMICNTFPRSFIDLSLGPINSFVNLNGHTIDVINNNFIGDFDNTTGQPAYYDIEVYGGNVINCGIDGNGCIQWGGSGAGLLHLHDMNFTTIGNFITSSLNNQPGIQKAENINVNQKTGYIITGWFDNLSVINTTAALVPATPEDVANSGVFAVDGGVYFLDPFRHTGFAQNSDFDISNDGVGTSSVTLLDTDINPLTECINGCDLVTWTVLNNPPPVTLATNRSIILKFKSKNDDSVSCATCDNNHGNGNAVVKIATTKTGSEGCDYINNFLSSISSASNPFKSVQIDKTVCSNTPLLSSVPLLHDLTLTANNKNMALFMDKK